MTIGEFDNLVWIDSKGSDEEFYTQNSYLCKIKDRVTGLINQLSGKKCAMPEKILLIFKREIFLMALAKDEKYSPIFQGINGDMAVNQPIATKDKIIQAKKLIEFIKEFITPYEKTLLIMESQRTLKTYHDVTTDYTYFEALKKEVEQNPNTFILHYNKKMPWQESPKKYDNDNVKHVDIKFEHLYNDAEIITDMLAHLTFDDTVKP